MLYVSSLLPSNALTVAFFKSWMTTGSTVPSCTPVVIFLTSSRFPRGIVGSKLLVASSMSAFILDVLASFLHSGGNGNIRICWISSGRGILEVCQHVKKHIWQVKLILFFSWPFLGQPFWPIFLGLPASAVLNFHRNPSVLNDGVFFSECVNTWRFLLYKPFSCGDSSNFII